MGRLLSAAVKKGHKKPQCPNQDKWASYAQKKPEYNADLTSTGNSKLFSLTAVDSVPENSVITIHVASANHPADYWIQDTRATNHVTRSCHLFDTSSFEAMTKGEHRVRTANNSFIDVEGSETITFYASRPRAKQANRVLQPVLYIPACGTNNLLSIIQLM